MVFTLLAVLFMLLLGAEGQAQTPNEIYGKVEADLFGSVPPAKRRVTRYLSLNSYPVAERPRIIQAIDSTLNHLSFRSQLYHGTVLGADSLLMRIDLTGLGWDRESRIARKARLKLQGVTVPFDDDIWETFVRDDPYWKVDYTDAKGKYHKGWLDPAVEQRTRLASYSASLILRADWLISKLWVEKANGGYYSAVLLLPDNERDLYRYLGVDEKLIDRDPQLRVGGASLKSIVALHNRELQLIPSLYGHDERFTWRTFDVLNDADKAKNVLETFGGKIKHDGREIIFTLPNGLHGYYLADGAGKQVAVVPQAIAIDMRPKSLSRDRNVVNAIACVSCHGPVSGIQPFIDPVRTAILDPEIGLAVLSNDYKKIVEKTEDLESYYRVADKGGIERDVIRHQESYARRIEECTGLDPIGHAERITHTFDAYVHDLVTPEQAAREMGLSLEQAKPIWQTSGESQLVVLTSKGSPAVRRAGWERVFVEAMRNQTYRWEKALVHPN